MKAFSILRTSMVGLAAVFSLAAASAQARPRVEIWTDRGNHPVYREGSAMRVKVRASMDAYLLVYELGPDGNVSLLHPWKRGSGRIEGGRTLRVPPDGSNYLLVANELGKGLLVVIASERPFRNLPVFLRPFDPQAASVGYEDASTLADEDSVDSLGSVTGDPMLTMERIRRRVLLDPDATETSATAYTTYTVRDQEPPPIVVLAPMLWPQEPSWPGTSDEPRCPEPSAQREPELGSARENPPQQQEPPRPPPVYKGPPPQPEPPRFANPPQAKPDRPDPPRGKGR